MSRNQLLGCYSSSLSDIVYIHRDTDDAIIRPLPRVKRLLSDSVCLPHVVQLLLTFDPVLVEKVATLLCEVMRDNPNISTLYLKIGRAHV
jgi:DnaJ family protein C protein 13